METLNRKKYRYMQISIASPEEIKSWATREINGEKFYGEVKNSETLHHRSFKPIEDGLCCEKIFGPVKDNTCACNNKTRKGGTDLKVCPKCHVELTSSKVRRERMGYIQLETPVVHTWFFKNSPNKIAILLNEKAKDIENIIYYASYIVVEVSEDIDDRIYNCRDLVGENHENLFTIQKGDILTEYQNHLYSRYLRGAFKSLSGAEAIKYLLHNLDLKATIEELREEFKTATKQRKEQIVKRLELCEAFYHSGNKPEWMVMDVIPVIPPDLRPMVQLDGGRWTTTDLIKLYQSIINRNNQLKNEREQNATEIMMKNVKRLIQVAVDELIDFSKSNKKAAKDKTKALKSLSDILRGKQGRFRQNLLGKRVDFSGRSVIVVGPDLKMYQCGIPRQMALTLFEPFIINYLMNKEKEKQQSNLALGLDNRPSKEKTSVKRAKEMITLGTPEAMEALEHVIIEHPVLLNRAPTLHRLSIQAFEPKLVEGKAIRLHPLVTTAFNADFDGDQMPVHVPLSQEAQAEARLLMLASKNILAPKDGKPIVTPSQDMILGNYYLTIEKPDPREGHAFKDMAEAEHAYEEGLIGIHTRFVIPASSISRNMINLQNVKHGEYQSRALKNQELKSRYLITTIGKYFFNSIFPDSMPYVNSPTHENLTYGVDEKYLIDKHLNYKDYIANLPCQEPVKKKFLSVIIAEVFKQCHLAETSNTLDKMKDIGFKYSTRAGITISAFDVINVEGKQEVLAKADSAVDKYRRLYERGMMLEEERYKKVVDQWNDASNSLKDSIKSMMKKEALSNDIFLMADSGARGSDSNFLQLAGMRGLMAKPNGQTMEIPIKSNFNEGLTMSEYFISTHGARKGSTDTALKTAESGYLTRRLVDVSQDVIITCDDCGTDKGIYVKDIYADKAGVIETDANGVKKIVVPLYDRILGRHAAEEISYIDDNGNKEIVVRKDQFITDGIAEKIIKYRDTFFKDNPDDFPGVRIRTIFTCNAANLSGGEHGCPTPNGVCRKCYGSDLSTNQQVEKGEVVGVIAAQSIGEPGTQLTMRTFHSGGVAGDDITQGLPRIQELFEAREPKVKAHIAKFKGTVVDITHDDKDNRTKIKVRGDIKIKSDKKESRVEEIEYITDSGKKAVVKKGDHVEAGQQLSEGLIHPKELIKYASVLDVENYILKEVEKVYRSQSVDIQDKHVEIIIKQMLQKVLVVDPGNTNLLQGTYVSKPELYKVIKECYQKYHGKGLPAVKPVLLGITRSSLKSDSFLSAASFQETTRVLTEAAIHGKIDKLEGLKENIIIGGLIPAGTGLVDNVELDETISLNKYNLED